MNLSVDRSGWIHPLGPFHGPREAVRGLGAYLGIWTVVALFNSSARFLYVRSGLSLDLVLGVIDNYLITNFAWALVALVTLALVRKVPLSRKPTARAWATHLGASLVLTPLGIVLMVVGIWLMRPLKYGFLPSVGMALQNQFHASYLVYYWGVVGIHELASLYRRTKERQLVATQLQTLLVQAQTEALNAQVSPHFLFNTLNLVAALIHSDPAGAERILLKLSGLLRASLSQAGDQESTLNRELGFLESYLDIERFRFGDRLDIDIQIPPPLLEANVPAFLLQPLIECAIRQGVSPRAGGGRITVRAREEGGSLVLEVEQEGPWPLEGSEDPAGSLSPIRSRLAQLYRGEGGLRLQGLPEGGSRARVEVPLARAFPARNPDWTPR